MSESEKSEKREQRVEQAKRFLIRLENEIEIAELTLETIPKYFPNSNIANPDRTLAIQELNALKKKLEANKNAVQVATVDDEDVKKILDNINI